MGVLINVTNQKPLLFPKELETKVRPRSPQASARNRSLRVQLRRLPGSLGHFTPQDLITLFYKIEFLSQREFLSEKIRRFLGQWPHAAVLWASLCVYWVAQLLLHLSHRAGRWLATEMDWAPPHHAGAGGRSRPNRWQRLKITSTCK